MKRRKKRSYFNPEVILFLFVLFIIFLCIYLKLYYHRIETEGIPVQCEIQSVREVWESSDSGYQTVTCVKYNIDEIEYTYSLNAYVGKTGDIVEMVYLPSELGAVYFLKNIESRSQVVNYVLVGWVLGWIFLKVFMDIMFKLFYRPWGQKSK